MLVKVQKIITLHQLVGKFGKRHSLSGFARKAFFYRVLCHHVVYGDVLANIADKTEERKVLHPVVIVHHFGAVGGVGIEVEQFPELFFQTFLVMS